MSHLLEVRNLTVGIKKKEKILKAVHDISFSIDEGEILGLAGESGCGKTLTALSIPNLLPEAAKILNGEIIYDNKSLTSLSKKEMYRIRGREISFVFQEVRQSLNPLLKVGSQITETLELGGYRNRGQNKSLALEILKSLGFDEPEKIFKAFPHQLSGGMCQRIMTAIATICRPRLILADEPSSALDPESQNRILCLLADMNRNFKTSVLIISHDLSIIQKFCGRFLVMYSGRIIEEGPSRNFFSPLHPYTKALIRAIPDKQKRGKKLENIPGKVPSIEDGLCGCPFAPRCKKIQSPCLKTFPPPIDVLAGRVHCYFPEIPQKGKANG
ncbi:MAG: ABC transporter ATP-binding protein [Treponema sp.]|jgi:peptide/nickel transport system ATP-binding protein|nr:ABC transporter ATP-binding protein [Treponema sp.]